MGCVFAAATHGLVCEEQCMIDILRSHTLDTSKAFLADSYRLRVRFSLEQAGFGTRASSPAFSTSAT